VALPTAWERTGETESGSTSLLGVSTLLSAINPHDSPNPEIYRHVCRQSYGIHFSNEKTEVHKGCGSLRPYSRPKGKESTAELIRPSSPAMDSYGQD
jgi:hypothetical protein